MSDPTLPLPIPEVPKRFGGILGNIPDLEPTFPVKAFWRFAELYGPIVQFDAGGSKLVVLSDYETINPCFDDDLYEKSVVAAVKELRPYLSDGLFTAYPEELNWHKAHRILMPVFGPLAVRKMFHQQLDICSQLILRWDRFGPTYRIQTSDDFTRLAFDTIALSAFGHRFNNFYSETTHPFLNEMVDVLVEAGKRTGQSDLEKKLRLMTAQKFDRDIKSMHKLCDEIVQDRIENPRPDIHDMLNVMLSTKDPVDGQRLDDEHIRNQMATFLVAGHETTSGTLSFLFYYLLQNPETYHKAQQEVDEVLGSDIITVDHVPKFKYIAAAIKEALRMEGPIPVVTRKSKHKIRHVGKYDIEPSVDLIVNLRGLHHDPKIWGEDHNEFKPERMMDMSKHKPGSWRPFGVGVRSCIGRAFAEQEMIIVVASILQRFQITMADPSYKLELKSTLTLKPGDFEIFAKRRPGVGETVGFGGSSKSASKSTDVTVMANHAASEILLVLYGSNAGTCKTYAEEIVADAERHGIKTELMTLDDACEHERAGPVVIITPSYEGKPADNARKFVSWLEVNSNTPDLLRGRRYALFGVGNSEWASTYQKIPKLIDDLMPKVGATRVHETGFVDVRGDAVGPFEAWREGLLDKMFDTLTKDTGPVQGLEVELVDHSGSQGSVEVQPSLLNVKTNKSLSGTEVGPQKMHLEVTLPESMCYRSGDYLAVYPSNHPDIVNRVLKHFGMQAGQYIRIVGAKKSFLQTNDPMIASEFISTRVELYTPVTQRQLIRLAELATDAAERENLGELAVEQRYTSEVLANRFSVLDILEDFNSVKLSFSGYLDMLKALTFRQYSISSSPLASMQEDGSLVASITYDVHASPAWSGNGRAFYGVASSHLASLKPGSQLRAHIRPTNGAFHLPVNSETPCIFFGAGTGIAPMRGFLQERAAQLKAGGKNVGKSLLYVGCRDYRSDYIYKEELEEFERLGIVSLRPAFSKYGDPCKEVNHKYTSDHLWADRDEAAQIFRSGAKIFVCGSASRIAKSTAETCKKIYAEGMGCTPSQANEWFEEQREVRYVSDVYG